ncbi:MarR family winged helix-turn-helix transcriptional regulator [Paracoccus sanguinis]|uniref:Transcriptional regulator, MarR family n=1 Tax=Paracoccus sanguinis TaxID=1545044 RepID=A0A1H2Y0D6_9RHOB|nr:transcriptional regulator, MarR family [Paracoccus sanguinis]
MQNAGLKTGARDAQREARRDPRATGAGVAQAAASGLGAGLGAPGGPAGAETLLSLTDEQIRRGMEAMYFAYRAFTSDPDLILAEIGYGRAHHRALYFIHRDSGLTVTALLEVLGVTKQSLNRVLRALIEDGLVDSRIGRRDRRERQLTLTDKGAALERRLSESQRARMRAAYRAAGPQAVTGFRQVLEAMMDGETRAQFQALRDAPPAPGEVGAGPRG